MSILQSDLFEPTHPTAGQSQCKFSTIFFFLTQEWLLYLQH